ncbi:glycine-rich protein [Hymenobacter monticola]|uniref:receptor protein-tyrosine kinase n=1 Tax=Hymenobacter monticola TaxID=1705399 RepID=A0ABY4BEI1_9BACT|nr:glycine-rich protein [Hymenobacter monticola]UOE36151.1 glycine-rich protein [Hymenobacter monticola]
MLKLYAARCYTLALLLAAPLATLAQTGGVRVGTPGAPDPSAVLDLRPDAASAPKGLLPPRLTLAQRDAIRNPAAGLTVFNTTTGALNVWNGAGWVASLTDQSDTGPVEFSYTGSSQTYTVPAGITRLLVDMAGATGGMGSGLSGFGGRVQATLAVVPGEVLTINVGKPGSISVGSGGVVYTGGEATDIRRGGSGLTDRVLVAGGGGGGGSAGYGGHGGGLIGGSGGFVGGGGGTQTAPGAGGTGAFSPGAAGSGALGAPATSSTGGGGGGGYYGGGSGAINSLLSSGGGGGGSSYAGAGTSNVVHTQGYQAGYGYVRLRNADTPAPVLDARNFVNLSSDNLGNHTATQNLNLGTNQLVGNGGSGLSISNSGTVTTAGAIVAGGNVQLGTNQLTGNGSVNVGNNLNLGANQLVGNGGTQGLRVASTGAVTLAAGLSLPIRTVNQVAGSYQSVVLTDADHTVRSGTPQGVGGGILFGFFLPDPAGRTGRVYVLLNYGSTNARLYTATPANSLDATLVYDDASGSVTQVPRASRLTVQSNGSIWLVLSR